MKEVEYDGSLVSDIKGINRGYSFFDYLKENKAEKWLIVLLIVMICVTGLITHLNLPTLLACYTGSYINLYVRYKECKSEFNKKKKEKKKRIKNLSKVLSARKYIYPELKRAKIFEMKEVHDEMDNYIEIITSDVYYINDEDKIAVLREVKNSCLSKGLNMSVKKTKLYELEEDDLPRVENMPVRQVLRLIKED